MTTKFKIIAISSALAIGLTFAPPARADSLNVLGGTLTWPDKMYISDSCSKYSFAYLNGTGVELLQLSFDLTDPYGRSLAYDSAIGIKAGISGTFDVQICSYKFSVGNGPYTVKLSVEDYANTKRSITKDINFLSLPGATPTPATGLPTPTPTVTVTAAPKPAPTVTVTAEPLPAQTIYQTNPADVTLKALIASLNSQIKMLNAKLKVICAVKPKPKGC